MYAYGADAPTARRRAREHEPAHGRVRTEYTYGDDPRDIPG
ncbi:MULTISPECIES: hypothetical protein [unclassified Streptomyces]|nr:MULTISPECIES: hypothetical protein [unclassified Streptomyces]MCZ7414761.1 hypothetical protein [Streptomyces sp. WMMC897]MCZ7431684.1 hypothetical protein [Streptomyces sp. WMMC1477]